MSVYTVWVCVHLCACTAQKLTWSVFLVHAPLYLLREHLKLNPEFASPGDFIQPTRPNSVSASVPWVRRLQAVGTRLLAFTWVLGIWTCVLCLCHRHSMHWATLQPSRDAAVLYLSILWRCGLIFREALLASLGYSHRASITTRGLWVCY